MLAHVNAWVRTFPHTFAEAYVMHASIMGKTIMTKYFGAGMTRMSASHRASGQNINIEGT